MRKIGMLGALIFLLVLPTLGHALNLNLGGSGGSGLGNLSCPDVGGNHVNIVSGVPFCGSSSSGSPTGNAAADGITKGIVAFNASRFTCVSGVCDLATTLAGRTLTTPTITVQDTLLTVQDDADPSKQVRFQLAGIPTVTMVTLTVPPATGTLLSDNNVITSTGKTFQDAAFVGTTTGITKAMVGLSAVDNTSNVQERAATRTLTNATLDPTNTVTLFDTLFSLQNVTTPSKQGRFSLAGLTAGTSRIYLLPDASDTLVCLTCSQTLSNKTLISPTIAAIGNLTLNGFVKTGGGIGTLSVDTTVYAQTGVDINASHQVTVTHLAAPLPVAQGGTGLAGGTSGGILAYTAGGTLTSSGVLGVGLPVLGGGAGAVPTVGAKSGNTPTFVTLSGPATPATCAQFDASGNVASTGSACGTTGTGNVSSVFGRSGVVIAAAGDYSEAQISFTDITTNNATTAAHGYLPKLPGGTTTFLRADGTFALPASGTGNVVSANVGTSIANEVVLWSSADGVTVKRATGSGLALLTSGVLSSVAAPSGTVLGTTDAQAVASKTLDNTNIVTLRDDRFTLQDDGNTGRQVVFQLSGLSVGIRTWTFPDVSGTFASLAGPQTLANTTLASGLFTTSLTGPLLIGGAGAASSLTLQSTSGAGTTDSIVAKVGNAGVVTAWTTDTTGQFGLGVVPAAKLHILGTSAEIRQTGSATNQSLSHCYLDNNTTVAGCFKYLGAAAGGSRYLSLESNAADALQLLAVNSVPIRFGTNNLLRAQLSNTLFDVGANGTTNPAFRVDYSAASVITGVSITGGAAGTAPSLATLSTNTDEGLTLNAKGSATLRLQTVSTGNVLMGGETARTFGMERRTGSTNPGLGMTVNPGGAASGASNAAGGDTDIYPGQTTGTGRSLTKIKCYLPATVSGTGDNGAVDCLVFGASKRISDNVTTSIVNMTLANNTATAVELVYSVEVRDASNVQQIEAGRVTCRAVNVAGVVTQNECQKTGNAQSISNTPTSTVDVSWTITAANPAVVQILVDSSLVPSTGLPFVHFPQIANLGSQAMAVP